MNYSIGANGNAEIKPNLGRKDTKSKTEAALMPMSYHPPTTGGWKPAKTQHHPMQRSYGRDCASQQKKHAKTKSQHISSRRVCQGQMDPEQN